MPFVEPNFRCRVAEPDSPGRKFSFLVRADTEADARSALERRHYIVYRIKRYDFAAWKRAGAKATAAAQKNRDFKNAADRKTHTFPALWGPLKEALLELFHRKCAYCDAQFEHVAYGDVEHFRPKGGVTDEPDHPGYWWLAYEPSNYLPSCALCNQGDAKKNHFPIGGKRAYGPGDDLDAEKPDLLNPYIDNFQLHLKFNPSSSDATKAGVIDPLDQTDLRASASIISYKLNRPNLLDFRLKSQRIALQEYQQAYVLWILSDLEEALQRFVHSCKSGEREFSLAAMAEVNEFARRKRHHPPF
jgi:hypothetical protein